MPVFVPKARSAAENLEDPGNIFRLFMDDIIEKIYEHTNEQMERRKEQRRKENKKDQSYYRDCTRNEILGLIGLLILAGVKNQES